MSSSMPLLHVPDYGAIVWQQHAPQLSLPCLLALCPLDYVHIDLTLPICLALPAVSLFPVTQTPTPGTPPTCLSTARRASTTASHGVTASGATSTTASRPATSPFSRGRSPCPGCELPGIFQDAVTGARGFEPDATQSCMNSKPARVPSCRTVILIVICVRFLD